MIAKSLCATTSAPCGQYTPEDDQESVNNRSICVDADMCASSATTSAPCGKYTPEDDQESVNDDGYGCPAFPAGSSCSQFTGTSLHVNCMFLSYTCQFLLISQGLQACAVLHAKHMLAGVA